jgi:hypothetical protein
VALMTAQHVPVLRIGSCVEQQISLTKQREQRWDKAGIGRPRRIKH